MTCPSLNVKAGVKPSLNGQRGYQCGHADMYRDERSTDLSPRKRRSDCHHKSVKDGCKAYFFLRKVIDAEVVKVEYQPEHNGYNAGTVGDMAQSMLTLQVKQWIEEKVDSGMNWTAIKKLLRLDADILNTVSQSSSFIQKACLHFVLLQLDDGSCTNIPESLSVLHQDVYNAICRRIKKITHLNEDGDQSLQLWQSRLQERGYAVMTFRHFYAFFIISW